MPNHDFYAVGDDHRSVLEFVFDVLGCQVRESYSAPNAALREFSDAKSALAAWDEEGRRTGLMLDLYHPSAGGLVRIRRFDLDERPFGRGAFRHVVEGWGLIQLHLADPRDGRLARSHTNHNSQKRAQVWAATYPELERPDTWDWTAVTRVSSRLNRYIRKLAVDKRRGRSVLSGALEWERQGGIINPR